MELLCGNNFCTDRRTDIQTETDGRTASHGETNILPHNFVGGGGGIITCDVHDQSFKILIHTIRGAFGK